MPDRTPYRIKITIEIDDAPPLVILSSSREKVEITGFQMEPQDPADRIINGFTTSDKITLMGELFAAVKKSE